MKKEKMILLIMSGIAFLLILNIAFGSESWVRPLGIFYGGFDNGGTTIDETGIKTAGNFTVIGDFVNVSVIDYNVTGTMMLNDSKVCTAKNNLCNQTIPVIDINGTDISVGEINFSYAVGHGLNLSTTTIGDTASTTPLNSTTVKVSDYTSGLTNQTYGDGYGIRFNIISYVNNGSKNHTYLDGDIANCASDLTFVFNEATNESRLDETDEMCFFDNSCYDNYDRATLFLDSMVTVDSNPRTLYDDNSNIELWSMSKVDVKTNLLYVLLENESHQCKLELEHNLSDKLANYSLALEIIGLNTTPDIRVDDYITIDANGTEVNITLPAITTNDTLFIATDGSTYYDSGMTSLARSAGSSITDGGYINAVNITTDYLTINNPPSACSAKSYLTYYDGASVTCTTDIDNVNGSSINVELVNASEMTLNNSGVCTPKNALCNYTLNPFVNPATEDLDMNTYRILNVSNLTAISSSFTEYNKNGDVNIWI